MLAAKIEKQTTNVWLINTGWIGGGHGIGSRIKLKYTRAIIDAIHSGDLLKSEYKLENVFGLQMPTTCPQVPEEILIPENLWEDKEAYKKQVAHLAGLFNKNFEKYKEGSAEKIVAAGPKA